MIVVTRVLGALLWIILTPTIGACSLGSYGAAEIHSVARIMNIGIQQESAGLPGPQIDQGCPDGSDVRTSDLCAQWKAADAAYSSSEWAEKTYYLSVWSFVVTTIALIAAGFAAFFGWLSHKTSRESLEHTKEQTRSQMRAYINIHDIVGVSHLTHPDVGPMHYGAEGFITFENVGSTRGVIISEKIVCINTFNNHEIEITSLHSAEERFVSPSAKFRISFSAKGAFPGIVHKSSYQIKIGIFYEYKDVFDQISREVSWWISSPITTAASVDLTMTQLSHKDQTDA